LFGRPQFCSLSFLQEGVEEGEGGLGSGEGGGPLLEGGQEVLLGGAPVVAVRVCGFHILAASSDTGGGLAVWSWGEDAARQLCRALPAGIDLDDTPAPIAPLPTAAPSTFGCGGFQTLLASDGVYRYT